MSLKRYRAVQHKVRSKTVAERNNELVRILRAGDEANRAVYESLRKSGLNQKLAEMTLNGCHLRR